MTCSCAYFRLHEFSLLTEGSDPNGEKAAGICRRLFAHAKYRLMMQESGFGLTSPRFCNVFDATVTSSALNRATCFPKEFMNNDTAFALAKKISAPIKPRKLRGSCWRALTSSDVIGSE